MPSDAKRRANAKYEKNNVKRLSLAFYPTDRDLLEWIAAQPNKQGYIKGLIRSDMERAGRGA